jgi:hypothetical protein
MEGQHAQSLFEAAIFPAVSGFVLCLGVILFTAWRPAPRPNAWRALTAERRRQLVIRTTRLVIAGFVACLVLFYSVILQHEPEAVSALWGIPFLLALTLPSWLLLTWLADRRAGKPRSQD